MQMRARSKGLHMRPLKVVCYSCRWIWMSSFVLVYGHTVHVELLWCKSTRTSKWLQLATVALKWCFSSQSPNKSMPSCVFSYRRSIASNTNSSLFSFDVFDVFRCIYRRWIVNVKVEKWWAFFEILLKLDMASHRFIRRNIFML